MMPHNILVVHLYACQHCTPQPMQRFYSRCTEACPHHKQCRGYRDGWEERTKGIAVGCDRGWTRESRICMQGAVLVVAHSLQDTVCVPASPTPPSIPQERRVTQVGVQQGRHIRGYKHRVGKNVQPDPPKHQPRCQRHATRKQHIPHQPQLVHCCLTLCLFVQLWQLSYALCAVHLLECSQQQQGPHARARPGQPCGQQVPCSPIREAPVAVGICCGKCTHCPTEDKGTKHLAACCDNGKGACGWSMLQG